MRRAPTVGALCAGVGGIELALSDELAAEPIWHAENDADASAVLAMRARGVPNLGDITRIAWSRIEVPDIMTAGVPCQPISAAGRQRHREDPRYLWPHAREAFETMQPRRLFLENVQNLVSIDGGTVLREWLADLRAAGYAARWCVLGACAVGLSHHRHRWFCRAEYVGAGAPEAVRVPARCGAPPRRVKLLPSPMARDGDPKGRGEGSAEYWQRRRNEGRWNGIPLGAAVNLLPTPRASDGTRRTDGTKHRPSLVGATRLLPTPRATDGKNGGPNQRGSKGDLALPAAVIGERFAEYAPAVLRQVEATGVLPPEPTEPNKNGAARLAPAFPEWMMTFPRGWVTEILDRVPALRCIGNAVAPRQAAVAWHLLDPAVYERATEIARKAA